MWCILLIVSVLNLLDDFTLVIIIVAVSALTLSVAAVVSKYVFTALRNVRCATVSALFPTSAR